MEAGGKVVVDACRGAVGGSRASGELDERDGRPDCGDTVVRRVGVVYVMARTVQGSCCKVPL